MSESLAFASANTFAFPASAPILAQGHALWGILDSVEHVGGGLLLVCIADMKRLVDEELLNILQPLAGEQVAICHIGSHWGAGRLP
jgi:hypothetical protein